MANKTIEIDETTYIIAPLNFGQGKELFHSNGEQKEINTPLLRYSLNNVDGGTRTDDDIDGLPYVHAMQLILECLEINGLRKPKPGEEQPAREVAK
jgi:hypothetical protein